MRVKQIGHILNATLFTSWAICHVVKWKCWSDVSHIIQAELNSCIDLVRKKPVAAPFSSDQDGIWVFGKAHILIVCQALPVPLVSTLKCWKNWKIWTFWMPGEFYHPRMWACYSWNRQSNIAQYSLHNLCAWETSVSKLLNR